MATGISSGTTFFIGCDIVLGKNMWDSSKAFTYDPSSTVVAVGVKNGGADDGSFTFTGTWNKPSELDKVSSPGNDVFDRHAAAFMHEALKEEILKTPSDGEKIPRAEWDGTATWVNDTRSMCVLADCRTVVSHMNKGGFYVDFQLSESIVHNWKGEFLIGKQAGPGLAVPSNVTEAWDLALKAASPMIINKGIHEIN